MADSSLPIHFAIVLANPPGRSLIQGVSQLQERVRMGHRRP